ASKGRAAFAADSRQRSCGEIVRGPRDDRLNRLLKVTGCRAAAPFYVALSQRGQNLLQNAEHALPRLPFSFGTQEVLLGYHLADGSNILSHATMHEHQTVLEASPCFPRSICGIENTVLRH